METNSSKHRDRVERKYLIELIEKGTPCEYSYTHYNQPQNGRVEWYDEKRKLSKIDALDMIEEQNEKRADGFRFSPSRCATEGYVRALRRPDNEKEIYILFCESDRKPSFQEIVNS